MPAKYPFLSLWKKDGLKKFPSVPFQQILNHFVVEFFEPINAPDQAENKTPYLDDDFETRLRQRFNEIKRSAMGENIAAWDHSREMNVDYDEWERSLAPLCKKFIFEETQRALQKDWFEWGMLVGEARKKLLNGADREKTLRELGQKILPSKRGGASLLTGIQLRTLKSVYLEMQEAIKETRRPLDLNQAHPDPDEAQQIRQRDLSKLCPWTKSIFEPGEIKKILSQKTPADVAADIIAKRLGRALNTNITSGRSLQNKLGNVRPILR
jgi:hypothetical protein